VHCQAATWLFAKTAPEVLPGPWKNATWIWVVRLPIDQLWKKSWLKTITPWVCVCQTAKNIGPITSYRLLTDIQRFMTCWKENT
jgi:hypothetical protein